MRTEDYIADNIIALCKKRDMSKYRLSQLTGISQSSIGKIIAKESLPTMPTVEKICDALGVTMAQFFAGMDVPVSLSESQQEVLNIWNNLDEKEQNVVIQMLRGLQKIKETVVTKMLTVSFLWSWEIMVIEKKYYDIAQRELEEMQREINEEKAQMSEEEILEDKKWHDEQLETIIKKAEAHMRRFKKVPDSQKVVKFTFLQKDALEIARNMQMNIKTERKEDDLWGTIEMSFNNMWFLDSAPSEWKDIWNNLMKEAQRVYIEAKDNMIMYQYYYDLAVEVPCVQTQYK